jgi:hypothetical protein
MDSIVCKRAEERREDELGVLTTVYVKDGAMTDWSQPDLLGMRISA